MNASDTDITTWPDVREACKLPVPVDVRFAAAAGICDTLEGPVSFAPGDPVLTGTRGEHWTMQRARFDRTYEPLPGTCGGEDGDYRKRPATVHAVRLQSPADIALGSGNGVLHGEVGDWLVQYGPGDFGIVAAAIFDETYRFL
ncbi:PGDYG domain-containing protein [Janthinobacterium sp. 64]|uniref:PGDYG domain-containing protein n=1 Tax=Janthinobacterium sp. 64 TaxID=2035208 RepID=UPI000CBBD765|nr:PGDYG domain-containing protein [Janthinobacterium sp. 64]PKB23842.1 PGDYG protein [Janthinobacterium sp. 64]